VIVAEKKETEGNSGQLEEPSWRRSSGAPVPARVTSKSESFCARRSDSTDASRTRFARVCRSDRSARDVGYGPDDCADRCEGSRSDVPGTRHPVRGGRGTRFPPGVPVASRSWVVCKGGRAYSETRRQDLRVTETSSPFYDPAARAAGTGGPVRWPRPKAVESPPVPQGRGVPGVARRIVERYVPTPGNDDRCRRVWALVEILLVS